MLPLLPSPNRFPQPDWTAIENSLELRDRTFAELDAFWTERAREWVHLLRDALGAGYRGYESQNFWLISSQPESTCRRLIAWAEATRAKVNRVLGEAAATGELYGKVPILVVHDADTYYEYYAGYVADGEHALSSGVYLNRDYGHFLFSYTNLTEAEAVLAPELTHALVSHLPLPRWLDEGVAQLCEEWATGRDVTRYEEVKATIDTFWTPETIQEFWTGRSFNRTDEGQLHSYHLAKVLTRKLTTDLSRFRTFLRSADFADAGAAALSSHFNTTPGELVADYLGEDAWEPRLAPASETSPS